MIQWMVTMPSSDHALRVGGRRVEYRLSGADTRPALLYFHGSPGARTEVEDYEPGLLEELGICAVSADRPGYGGTDPLDGLDLLARTSDAVAVAEHLGMTRFAVQGSSGGGPYALACAVLMPDRVQAVILTSAGGDIGAEGGLDGLPENIANGWRRTWRDPDAARARLEAAAAGLRADPLPRLREMTSTFPADERDWAEKNGALAQDMVEAMRQRAVGWWSDGQAFGQPWPFDVAEIRALVHVFHGDCDSLAPLPVLRRSLARAPRVTEESIYPGGNHFAPWVTRERQAAMLTLTPG